MKTKILITLAVLCLAELPVPVFAQPANPPVQPVPPPGREDMGQAPPDTGMPPPQMGAPNQGATNGAEVEAVPAQTATAPAKTRSAPAGSTVILPKAAAPQIVPSQFVPPATPVGTNADQLRMNFRNAPLDEVLNYLSDAAGFIIVLNTHVSGTVSIVSTHPVSRDEAVALLNSELNRNGYAAIRNGRTLTIMTKSDAKTRDIPVKMGNNPDNIPDNDEIATWIIPIRFVDAQQLVSDLSAFVSPQATVVANEAGNSIVVTDTQSNIKHLDEIIQAVDNSAEAETEIRVFPLKYANPNDVANELGTIFPNSSTSSGSQAPVRFGGRFGRGGFFARMMENARGNNTSQEQRMQKATQVTAVADPRLQAVIVSAPKDLMEQIASMMTALDVPSPRDQKVYVYKLNHGDPNEVAQVLQNAFGSTTTGRGGTTTSSQESALQYRQQQNASTIGNSAASTSANSGRTGNSGSRFTGGGL